MEEHKLHEDLEDFSEEQLMESFMREVLSEEAVFIIGVLVALALVILTIVFFGNFWGSSKARNAVLLLGLCDSGKTLLFTRLLLGTFVRTQTSITENSTTYKSKDDRGSSWTLIDVPGHESLRVQIVEKYKAVAQYLYGKISQINSAAVGEGVEYSEIDAFCGSLLSGRGCWGLGVSG